MSCPFPNIETINDALDFHPDQTGFLLLNQDSASWRVKHPEGLQDAPAGWHVSSIRELVDQRIAAFEKKILRLGNINFTNSNIGSLVQAVRRYSGDILTHMTPQSVPEWTKRWNTRTMIYINTNGDAEIRDIPQGAFRDKQLIDYTSITRSTDGGARIGKESDSELVGTIPKDVYLDSTINGGGNRGILELMDHPTVIAMIPDPEQREKYLVSLGIIDMLQPYEAGSQSIWIPRALPARYMRWCALGFKADAFYPPNLSTLYFDLLLKRTN